MSAPSWVLDTNVVVAGLLTPQGVCAQLVNLVLTRQLRLTYDDRIEAEYREVLSRPRFAIPPARMAALLNALHRQDGVTAGPWKHQPPPDPDDQPFLEVALVATDQVLVTGNIKHFPPDCRGKVMVLTPREAWERLSIIL